MYFFIQEHWLMSNAISLLQTDVKIMLFLPKLVLLKINFYREDHYGGCGICICKSFPCISNMVETNCDQICAVLSEFTSFKILFICRVAHLITQTSSIQCYTSIAG